MRSAAPQSRPWSARGDGIAHSACQEARRYRLRRKNDSVQALCGSMIRDPRREAMLKPEEVAILRLNELGVGRQTDSVSRRLPTLRPGAKAPSWFSAFSVCRGLS